MRGLGVKVRRLRAGILSANLTSSQEPRTQNSNSEFCTRTLNFQIRTPGSALEKLW